MVRETLLHRMLCTILCWVGCFRTTPMKSFFRELGESLRDLEQARCQKTNRLVRTRMLGDVGEAPGNRAAIPTLVTR